MKSFFRLLDALVSPPETIHVVLGCDNDPTSDLCWIVEVRWDAKDAGIKAHDLNCKVEDLQHAMGTPYMIPHHRREEFFRKLQELDCRAKFPSEFGVHYKVVSHDVQ